MKRSKSAPGLIEASCRIPYVAPIRRTGSGIQRISSVKESDVKQLLGSMPGTTKHVLPSASSNSLLNVAPAVSSASAGSS